MKSLVDWLRRVAAITPELSPQVDYFRVFVAGAEPLDVEGWLASIEPQPGIGASLQAIGPESWSVMRLPDLQQQEVNIHARYRLGADIACVLSLALDRKVIVPNDLAVQVPELGKVIFHPVGQIVDQGLLGPLPLDAKQRINDYFVAVAGLPTEDQEIIGAAASAYHGALLLSDREPRSAYILLVAGIEALSRKYGSPPTGWSNWEQSAEWDKFFEVQGLSDEQTLALREKLMRDKQLRLKATFQTYGSERVEDSFWERSLDQWVHGIDANTGAWLPPTKLKTCRIADVLHCDRASLRDSLAKSYNLRSSVVHEAKWVELMTFAPPPGQLLERSQALPFPVLRALLADLIWIETSSRTSTAKLPDFQLLRNP